MFSVSIFPGPSLTNLNLAGPSCTIQKHFIGGFRPYYLEACQPDWNAIVAGFHEKIYRFNATLCQGNPRDVDRAYVNVIPIYIQPENTLLR
jgi:hypothetical protein